MNANNDELDAIEAAMVTLHKAAFQHRAWEELQREAGISLDRASATLLKAVAHCSQPCRMQNVAQYLGIEAPSVSRTVQQLERDGLLVRSPDSVDRRASNLQLSADGKALLRKLQKARRAKLEAAVGDWSSDERQQLALLLQKLGTSIAPRQTDI